MTDLTLTPKLMFILCVWMLFVAVFIRAFVRGKVASKQAQRIWLIFFLCCVAFTFWGERSELVINQYFGYRPIALLVKYISLISVAHLFYTLLNDVKPDHALFPMRRMAPVAIAMGLFGFLIYDKYKLLSPDEMRYLFIAARDSVVMVYVLLSFIPGTLAMRQDESIDMMRYKLNLIILTSLCFVVTALGSIIAAIWSVFEFGDPSIAASTVQPFVVLGIILFVLIMIPYRWGLILFHIRRFYTYYRLWCLEEQMKKLIGVSSIKQSRLPIATDSKELELAIYRATIFVLDFYPLLANDNSSYTLYQELHRCVTTSPNYDALVQRMARL